jgi:hypothetical protein
MRNDPVRALIELITNSDDSYGSGEGSIVIEIDRGRVEWSMKVKDRAQGMTATEIREKLLSIGGRTSGFEGGKIVRGNLGRGAKDVSIFGTARFDTIKDGKYTCCEIRRSQEAEIWTEQEADGHIRKRLGIPRGSGTVVTVNVTNQARCPQNATLSRVLSSHFQLRDIIQDSKRKLQLLTASGLQRLFYQPPESKPVINVQLSLPSYPDAKPNLQIWKLAERPENLGPSDPERISGILVKGSKAIYENTLFSSEGRPNAAWFAGELKCSFIDDLARTYDDTDSTVPVSDNPIGIISRDREGLQHAHPFYEELCGVVDEILGGLIDAEDKKQRGTEVALSAKLKDDLSKLGKELGKMFNEDTEDTDVDVPDTSSSTGHDPDVQIIPSRIVTYLGETKTVTVRVRESIAVKRIQVKISPEELVRLESGPKCKLQNGQTTLKLTPIAIGSGTITIRAGDILETALLEVRRERPAPPPPPEKLAFDRGNYTVKPGRQKKVRIVAPEKVILDHGDRVEFGVKGEAIVRIGGPVRLLPNDEGYFEAVVLMEARAPTGSVQITAYVGDTSAQATAKVAREQDTSGVEFNIQVRDQEAGPYRAFTEGNSILIMGRHPAVKRVLGKPPSFPLKDEPIGRSLIAEIVAFEMTRKVVEAKYKNRDDIDAAQIYHLHQVSLSRYLRKCQSLLHLS